MKLPRRILVVRPDRIGDVVLATPLVRALRQANPDAYIGVLARPYTCDVLLGNPNINAIIIDDAAGKHSGTVAFWKQVAALRAHGFDTALHLLPTRRHTWMTFFAGIRTRVGVGSRPYHTLTMMKTVSRRKYIPLRHEADYCLDLGRAVGVDSDDLSTDVFVSREERERARNRLPTGTLIGIHPGSGRSAPNWRPGRYAELVKLLLQRIDAHVVVTGTASERELARPILAVAGGRGVDLTGRASLRENIAAISCLDVLVSASTGPMHIAAGLRVPTVSLFCPLPACSPELWGPQGNHAEVVLPREGYCQSECPGDPHVCQFEGGIEPAEVARRVVDIVEER